LASHRFTRPPDHTQHHFLLDALLAIRGQQSYHDTMAPERTYYKYVQCRWSRRQVSVRYQKATHPLQSTHVLHSTFDQVTMHIQSLIVPSTLALLIHAPVASTYRIDLYSEWEYQGDQKYFTTEYVLLTDFAPLAHSIKIDQLRMRQLTSHSGKHKVPSTWSDGAKSWIWTSEVGDGCCIVFCRGKTNVGRYCGGGENPESSAGTTVVVTGCDDAVLNC